MKSLVIAEKPSVGRDIARVLHCSKNIPGALEGDKYIVTWALGHLVTLADPEEYDKKYSKWDMETLPMMPEKMQLVVIRQTAKQYGLVKKQLFRKDVNQIIIATDAGREGELVAGSWKNQNVKSRSNVCGSPQSQTKPSAKDLQTCVTAERTTIFTMRQKPGQKRTGWSASTLPER